MTKKDIKKRDEIADAISTKDMKDRYGDKNVKYAIATKIVMDKKKKKKKKKNMNEQLGALEQNLAQRQLAQSNMEKIGNSRVKITKTTGTGAGGLKNISVSDAGTTGKFMQNKINQSGSGMTANSLGVGNVGKFVSNKAGEVLDSNSTIPTGIKNELKKGLQDKALKINQNVPGTDAFKMKNIAMGINQKNLKASYDMDKSVIESDLIIQDWKKDDIKYTEVEAVDIIKPQPIKPTSSNWRDELDEDWQKVNRKDKTDGLSKKAVKAYRRENPGSKLKTAVTKDPKKLKKGSKDAKRRLSFCRRMKGMKKRLTSAKTARDPDSRINKALRRWNC